MASSAHLSPMRAHSPYVRLRAHPRRLSDEPSDRLHHPDFLLPSLPPPRSSDRPPAQPLPHAQSQQPSPTSTTITTSQPSSTATTTSSVPQTPIHDPDASSPILSDVVSPASPPPSSSSSSLGRDRRLTNYREDPQRHLQLQSQQAFGTETGQTPRAHSLVSRDVAALTSLSSHPPQYHHTHVPAHHHHLHHHLHHHQHSHFPQQPQQQQQQQQVQPVAQLPQVPQIPTSVHQVAQVPHHSHQDILNHSHGIVEPISPSHPQPMTPVLQPPQSPTSITTASSHTPTPPTPPPQQHLHHHHVQVSSHQNSSSSLTHAQLQQQQQPSSYIDPPSSNSAYASGDSTPPQNNSTKKWMTPTVMSAGYKVQTVVSEGSFGTVLKARRTNDGKYVALKVVAKMQLSEKECATIRRQAQALRSLKHRYIVEFLDDFEDPYYFYHVFEFLHGGDLYDRLEARGKPFSEAQALFLARQILYPISYLHARHAAHRDIKLENFVFETQPSNVHQVMKLIDFDLLVVRPPVRKDKHTNSQSNSTDDVSKETCSDMVGTILYVSPEIVSGRDHIPEESDMWAVGVMLFVLLSYQMPFQGATGRHILRAVRNNEPQFDPAVWSNVSEATRQLVEDLLNKDPSKRPTAQKALQRVKSIQAHARQVNSVSITVPPSTSNSSTSVAYPTTTSSAASVSPPASTGLTGGINSSGVSASVVEASSGGATMGTSSSSSSSRLRALTRGLRSVSLNLWDPSGNIVTKRGTGRQQHQQQHQQQAKPGNDIRTTNKQKTVSAQKDPLSNGGSASGSAIAGDWGAAASARATAEWRGSGRAAAAAAAVSANSTGAIPSLSASASATMPRTTASEPKKGSVNSKTASATNSATTSATPGRRWNRSVVDRCTSGKSRRARSKQQQQQQGRNNGQQNNAKYIHLKKDPMHENGSGGLKPMKDTSDKSKNNMIEVDGVRDDEESMASSFISGASSSMRSSSVLASVNGMRTANMNLMNGHIKMSNSAMAVDPAAGVGTDVHTGFDVDGTECMTSPALGGFVSSHRVHSTVSSASYTAMGVRGNGSGVTGANSPSASAASGWGTASGFTKRDRERLHSVRTASVAPRSQGNGRKEMVNGGGGLGGSSSGGWFGSGVGNGASSSGAGLNRNGENNTALRGSRRLKKYAPGGGIGARLRQLMSKGGEHLGHVR